MSLIPSESAAFPDLVGQHHGYLPPNVRRPSWRRRQQQQPASHATPPALPKSAEVNGAAKSPEAEQLVPLEVVTPLSDQVGPREAAPVHNDIVEQLEPLTPLEDWEAAPAHNEPVEQVVIPNSAPAAAETLEPLEPLEHPDGAPVHNETVEQVVLPASAPAAAEALEPLEPLADTNSRPAECEACEQGDPHKSTLPDTSRSPRVAMPIPPQRSSAQMRSKIQDQEVTAPTRAKRPRTPARGLAIAHPPPPHTDKPTSTWASRFPVLNLPRRRLLKLLRFILCETIAVGVLMLAMGFGFSPRIENDPLSLFLKVLAVTAAIAAIAVPIIFYGLPDELSRGDR